MTIDLQGLKGRSKRTMLQAMMHTENPDIIFGDESWLDEKYLDAEIFGNGYTPLRNDRNRQGCGIFIAYRNDLLVTQVKNDGLNNEFLLIVNLKQS